MPSPPPERRLGTTAMGPRRPGRRLNGPGMNSTNTALLEGWFREDLDLLPLEEIPRTKRAEAYLRLCEVEAIRGKADWDSLLEARRRLGEMAPELLKRYVLSLEGG